MSHAEEEVEPPCDPVDQDAGSDGEGVRIGDGVSHEPSRRPTPHGVRRTYAETAVDMLPSADEDSSDSFEWLSEMQRIVSGLAARQDIPDQWWAAVGLTRSMTSE